MISTRPAAAELALSDAEGAHIVELLGREPNVLELGMFGALWSEHCSYKTSRALLQSLPTAGGGVLLGPGENAGAVDVGDGLAAVFKIESHNHPSAIEPYQGAATGVGGILRDVFAMGARPIALLDSLRFGPLERARNRYLFQGVVGGIAGYGNCYGCPTVGGEIYFDEGYSQNPVVNVMCVGIARHADLKRAQASRAGDLVLLVGADTGSDGIHGAAFASAPLDDRAEQRRPAVQVGNPFLEKLLTEACLALRDVDGVTAIQDLGAGGLTSAAAEAAHRGGRGIEIEVQRVSRRERGLHAYEVMLSESQERMLVFLEPRAEAAVKALFHRFDLHADRIGRVLEAHRIRVRDGGTLCADLPLGALVAGVPSRHPRARRPPSPGWAVDIAEPDPGGALRRLLASPHLASRQPVFQQYDHQVLDNTVIAPGGDAALLRLKGTRRALAVTTDGNPRYCRLDPYWGTAMAVAEAARNISCTGACPLAITNCLNFGTPEDPEVFWQLQQAVAGLGAAARAFGLPVVSGNVSLYNETNGESIPPTPVVGMIGVLEEVERRCQAGFQTPGDRILLLGAMSTDLGGSSYLDRPLGPLPRLDFGLELRTQACVREAIRRGWLRSAHDVAEGGLAVALAESALLGRVGARCHLEDATVATYFGEAASRFVISCAPEDGDQVRQLAHDHGVLSQVLGEVGGRNLRIAPDIDFVLADLEALWLRGLA